MGRKADIRICRYERCQHGSREIDIVEDEYVKEKQKYYHSDCYKKKKDGGWKDAKTKEDLQYIKDQWFKHIDDKVVYGRLLICLNELIIRGFSSEYLVFVIDYVIKNRLNLNYPAGFKYFVTNKKIEAEYQKYLIKKSVNIGDCFKNIEDSKDSPQFKINKKPVGFGTVLRKGD